MVLMMLSNAGLVGLMALDQIVPSLLLFVTFENISIIQGVIISDEGLLKLGLALRHILFQALKLLSKGVFKDIKFLPPYRLGGYHLLIFKSLIKALTTIEYHVFSRTVTIYLWPV